MKTSYMQWILVSGLLIFVNAACVTTTPIGDVVVDGSISVEPQVVYRSSSRVTIGIGPSYTLDDAFYLANDHCRGYGYYAVPSSSRWDYTYDSYRNLVYYCRRRPVVITHPVVVHPSRPRYHHPAPQPSVPHNNGWWSRNRPSPPVVGTPPPAHRPIPAPPARRYEQDTRSITPQSPWSYNPRKNEGRSTIPTPPPVVTAPTPPPAPPATRYERDTRSTTTPSPWSYNSRKNEEPTRNTYTPPSTSSGSSSGGFWGKNSPSSKTSSGSDSSFSSGRGASSTSSSSSASSSSPGWWGKNKK